MAAILSDLRSIARALGGEVSGSQVLAPGPGHGGKDRSLSVKLCASLPDGFVTHSFAGDRWQDCRDHVRKRLGLPRDNGPHRHTEARRQSQESCREDDKPRARGLAMAATYVREMEPVRGTHGERYFRETRRIDTDAIADVLERSHAIGWHPAVYFSEPGHALHGQRLGCIVGVMTDPLTAKPTGAISRTYVDSDLRKIAKAKTLGLPAGIIRLTPDEDVTYGLCLAEGLETALSAMAKGLCPVWASGSTALMKTFPILAGIESLTVVADRDANGAGERAAREVEARWRAAGRETRIFMPASPGDLNDLLQRVKG